MKKILVLAYAISPTRGSEYSVAWNYVKNMSKNNKLTVLFGLAGDHMGDLEEMEECVKKSPLKNVTFVPIYPNKLANRLNWFNRHGVLIYTFYWAYQVWHKLAYRKAKELITLDHYDLIHYLSPIGYREPGFLWKIDLPYMWGPASGAKTIPWVLFRNLSLTARLRYGFHNIANSIQLRTKCRVRQAMSRTNLLLAATTENQEIFKKVFRKDCKYIPENCITDLVTLDMKKYEDVRNCIRLIFVGRLDYGKNLTMFFHALKNVESKETIHLDVVGDGPLRSLLEKQANDLGLRTSISFHGKLPRESAVAMFRGAHLHVITSLREGNPTTIWEAMSYGVPTLTLDHCGMHDTIKDNTGYKIPISSSYKEMVTNITEILNHIITNPTELENKAKAVWEDAKNYLWSEREKFFEECYNECIHNYNQKK